MDVFDLKAKFDDLAYRIERLEHQEKRHFSALMLGTGTTSSPVYPLDILGTEIQLGTNRTDNASKEGSIIVPHYDIDEEPLSGLRVAVSNGASAVDIGGGDSDMNSATLLRFRTAANANTLNGTVRLTVDSGGDVYSDEWTDYSSTSTIVGWSSFTTQQIFYKRIGNLVWVSFDLRGTSNATTSTFTLPLTSVAGGPGFLNAILVRDNSVTLTTPGRVFLTGGSATVACGKDMSNNGGFTSSGNKFCIGSFWYETA